MSLRTAPSLPVRLMYGVSQPSGRAVLAAAGDLGRAAVEREVDALALDPDGLVDAAVEQDVATGEQGPGRGRVVRRRRPSAGPAGVAVERPVGEVVLTRSCRTARSCPRPARGPPASTSSARRKASRLRCLARSAVSDAASGARTSRSPTPGRVHAERGEDRVGVRLRRARALSYRVLVAGEDRLDGRDIRAGAAWSRNLVTGTIEDLGPGRRSAVRRAVAGRGCLTACRRLAVAAMPAGGPASDGASARARPDTGRLGDGVAPPRAELDRPGRHEGDEDEQAARRWRTGRRFTAAECDELAATEPAGQRNAPSGRADGA